jgi:hypothetical protein
MQKSFVVGLLLLTFLMVGVAPVQAGGYQGASQWAVPELDKALEYGLITDRVRNQMNAPITREEFAEIAVKLYEKGTGDVVEASSMGVFTDTSNPEIIKAYDLGIVSGTDEVRRLFSPHNLITREQVAAMMYRTILAMGALKDGAAFAVFMDSDQISPYAQEAVHYMGGWELIKGSDYRFHPKGTCTREMAVLIAVRVYESAETFDPLPMDSNDYSYYDNGDEYSNYGNGDDSSYYGNGDDSSFDAGNNNYDPGYDPGYPMPTSKLPDNMSALIPLLPDAQIGYVDKWDGGDGTVMYATSYSISDAWKFYRDPHLYSECKLVEEGEIGGVPTISVQTNGLHYLISISENTGEGPPTAIQIMVFWHMYVEGVSAFPGR